MRLHRCPWRLAVLLVAGLCGSGLLRAQPVSDAPPGTVSFASADGRTELVGYLFLPVGAGPHPAVVMLHGRGGPYSSTVNAACTQVGPAQPAPSVCGAATLSRRHRQWGEFWAARGVLALLVDSFGPRGVAHGFGRGTHGQPAREPVNERTVRTLDAEGALAYLLTRPDVQPGRIALQGWSHGGSTALNVMAHQAQPEAGASPEAAGRARFVAALVFYPGCGPGAVPTRPYHADRRDRLQVFLAEADEEVSPAVCAALLGEAADRGAPIEVVRYEGATHDFDDPGPARQSVEANRHARADAQMRAQAWLSVR